MYSGQTLQPGQIWLIELPATDATALEPETLAAADVILYDRTLGPRIAEVLRGHYGEPHSADAAADGGPAVSARALKLAREGWRVIQLVRPNENWHRRLHAINGVGTLRGTGRLPARLIAAGTAPFGDEPARLYELPQRLGRASDDHLLALVVGPLAGGAAAAAYAVAGNGLAG
jgi:hypothetical protein